MSITQQDAALCDRNADSCRDSPYTEERTYEAIWRERAVQIRALIAKPSGLAEAKECIDAAVFEIGERFSELPAWMQDIWQRRVMFIMGLEA